MHLAQGLISSHPKISMKQATKSVCAPLLGISYIKGRYNRRWAEDCIHFNAKVLEYIRNTPSIKYIVMSSPYRDYTENTTSILTSSGEVKTGRQVSVQALHETVRTLKKLDKVPVIVSPTPQNGQNIGRCLTRAMMFQKPTNYCDINQEESDEYQYKVAQFIKEVENEVKVIWLKDSLCVGGVCKSTLNESMIYRDSGHLSKEGSAALGTQMRLYEQISK